jgi:hypothetical protein
MAATARRTNAPSNGGTLFVAISTTADTATTGAAIGREEAISTAEERLRLGKRLARAGWVRVGETRRTPTRGD